MDTPPPERILHIKDAPRRVQREYYRRERRNSTLAVCVILLVVSAIGYGVFRLVR